MEPKNSKTTPPGTKPAHLYAPPAHPPTYNYSIKIEYIPSLNKWKATIPAFLYLCYTYGSTPQDALQKLEIAKAMLVNQYQLNNWLLPKEDTGLM